ncbi:MAG: hypothetical protein ABWZ40_02905 [Caulobacterales bacterium]
MSDENKPSFADNLETIMGANQDMLDDMLADLFAVMPPDQAEAMKRSLLSIQDEYEADMGKLIEQTRTQEAADWVTPPPDGAADKGGDNS